MGQAILDVCFARLNLIETAYFGLRYLDEENQTVSSNKIFEKKNTFFFVRSKKISSFSSVFHLHPYFLI